MSSHRPSRWIRPDSVEHDLWLPPRQLRRYQWAKAVGGLLFTITFLLWMLIHWTSPTMRWTALLLAVTTGWVSLAALTRDHRRGLDRQIRIDGLALHITTPQGAQRILLGDVAEAQWRQDTSQQTGLWLFDCDGRVLGRLDEAFLADQDEARRFLGWARQRAPLAFPVLWPPAADAGPQI